MPSVPPHLPLPPILLEGLVRISLDEDVGAEPSGRNLLVLGKLSAITAMLGFPPLSYGAPKSHLLSLLTDAHVRRVKGVWSLRVGTSQSSMVSGHSLR